MFQGFFTKKFLNDFGTTFLLNTNQRNSGFITHTQTHILLKIPFSSLNICLANQEFGYLHCLNYLNEQEKLTSEKKGQVENSHKQLELKHIPFAAINNVISNK